MKRIFLFVILSISLTLSAQDLINSRTSSYYSYIFRISEQEAKTVYRSGYRKVEPEYFHTLVDSFPTDEEYKSILPEGHYLKVHSEKDRLLFDITTVQDYDVMIADNSTDLLVYVYDQRGTPVEGASLSIRGKKLLYDEKTRSYRDRKSNQKGLLIVKYGGFTTYYHLERQYNNSGLKRTYTRILYGKPLRYVWIPVRYVVRLPIDGTLSIFEGYPRGVIRNSWYFILSIFSPQEKQCNGYIVTNKPKYFPGDTVKVKAFLLDKNSKPFKGSFEVWINRYPDPIRLTTVKPYRDGGYSFDFVLHDSLNLRLDQNYQLGFSNGRYSKFTTFKYEDYELGNLQLKVEMDDETQFLGRPFSIKVKGTDQNDLNILDGRLEVYLTTSTINALFSDYVFVPDTLMYREMELESEGNTEIVIPDSIFPEANLNYNLKVTLITSDNEVLSESNRIDYYHELKRINHELLLDSIQFNYEENGEEESIFASVFGVDNFGNETLLKEAYLPCKIEIFPYYTFYKIIADTLKYLVDVSSESPGIQCFTSRNKDSIQLQVLNPRKLDFSYYIYKRDREKERGYTDTLRSVIDARSDENYYVSLQYLWGGNLKKENYEIPLLDKKLNIKVTEPVLVYPSQTTQIELQVTDIDGDPVPDVDITAYSLTSKFDYKTPSLPYLGEKRKRKSVINSFSIPEFNFPYNPGLKLDYNEWRLFAGLDSIEYYKFSFPGNAIYKNEYKTDNGRTQFSPFVFANGRQLPVHIVYVDNIPVYFSWSTNRRPYSFEILSGGLHRIRIRTRDAEYSINNVQFRQGYKTIISIAHNAVNENIVRTSMPDKLSNQEKRSLAKYMMPYRNTFGQNMAMLKQGYTVMDLRKDAWVYYNSIGPVLNGRTEFNLIGNYKTEFQFEPYYSYEFGEGLIKLRSEEKGKPIPSFFPYMNDREISDEVLTECDLLQEWQDILDQKRLATRRYYYDRATHKGNGTLRLMFLINSLDQPQVLNTLLFKLDSSRFLRVYNGIEYSMQDLEPGLYKALFFCKNSEYFTADSLVVNKDGTSYYRIAAPDKLVKDSFSIKVSSLIEEYVFRPGMSSLQEREEISRIHNAYVIENQYIGPGEIVEGYVVSSEDGQALPGVTILVRGTTIGTVTDLDGHYSLKVPEAYNELEFHYIGMKPKTLILGLSDTFSVSLEADMLALDEVVVVGYGVNRKETCASVVSVVNSPGLTIPGYDGDIAGTLQGALAGVDIIQNSGNTGAATTIRIRGSSSVEFDKSPLYVIDGQVFTGDIKELSPDMIKSIEILKDAGATAIYGTLGANGVVIISTNGMFKSTSPIQASGVINNEALIDASFQSSSIRQNFSDYAFWKPDLRTDSEGKVRFSVTFPDDITRWDTYYLAMNGKRQAGQSSGHIKSYKPLMAQLAVPRFLVEGDSTIVIGKVLNYTPDSLLVDRKFLMNEGLICEMKDAISRVIIDSLQFVAPEVDSVSLTYSLHLEDGYFDGEKRDIPVFPVGLEETSGVFITLDRDTSLDFHSEDMKGKFIIHARNDELGVLEMEISKQVHYLYECNEQLASKLKALLSERRIAEMQGKNFGGFLQVQKVIRLLNRNKMKDGLWGWWKDSKNESLWISVHVVEALNEAEEAGYRIPVDMDQIKGHLSWYLASDLSFEQRISVLKLLHLLDPDIHYSDQLTKLELADDLSLYQFLSLMELKQEMGSECNVDTLLHFRDTTLFGNFYYSDRESEKSLWSNDIQNTLKAYCILRNDTLISHTEELRKIRNYLFETRSCLGWTNTFESANIIETILPDILTGREEVRPARLVFSGGLDKEVKDFPFDTTIITEKEFMLKKTGDSPVYLTMYRRYWNPEPEEKKADLELHTWFDNEEGSNILEAGQAVNLKVRLLVKKHSDYVMLRVPIPAGCSYGDKKQHNYPEVHREYYRHETAIFCEKLQKGEYEFEIELLPRYSGKYTLNPAKVELMYFPTFNANTEIKKVEISPK